MTLVDLQGQGSRLRKPFGQIFVNKNDILTGWTEFEVTNASHFSSDTFRIVGAIAKLPPDMGPNYWDQSVGDELEIFAGFTDDSGGPGQRNSLIYGQVDEIEYDLIEQKLTLSGRDLSARFIDTKTVISSYSDHFASDIAKQLAAEHGMKAMVTPTKVHVGSYYEYYHISITKDQSEWDLLKFLAEIEGYDLWVSGETLYFQPPVPITNDPYVLLWSDQGQGNRVSNLETLKLQRSETLAKDIIVKVNSWNQSEETVVTAEAKRTGAKKNQRSGGQAQLYTFYPPNLTKEDAQRWANSKLENISKHEKVITGSLPGDNLMNNRSLIKLVGTGTDWDQVYNLDTVTRHMSWERGYEMDFRAKNHSTESTV